MSEAAVIERGRPDDLGGFRHDALFYDGADDFVSRTASFIRDGVEAREGVLVVVSEPKIELLRAELGTQADAVRFADMEHVGQNPARIIPAWRTFVEEQAETDRPFRGIGEPIWAARSADELDECERHEALLNVAFDGEPAWWLACPYDVGTLPQAVLAEAERNHPYVVDDGVRRPSDIYRGVHGSARPFDRPLPAPPASARTMTFDEDALSLRILRSFVIEEAGRVELDQARTDDLVLAASEVATNSMRHGGGGGELRMWHDGVSLICENSDAGRIDDPLVGRSLPAPSLGSGFGLWLANQVCDLVQIRTFEAGSVVRLHVRH
jgi:anti-sigma regulatory factor (Ser/Thr protein kinase)